MAGDWANPAYTVTIRSIKDTNKWLEPPPYSGTYTVTEENPDCTPGPGIVAGCTTFEFELDYPDSGPSGMGDPGPPFDAIADWATGLPEAGVGTWKTQAPANIIWKSREQINWGLIAYSNTALDTCTNWDGTGSNLLITPINPMGTDVSGILASMRLSRDNGVAVGGGTPTRSALNKAQQQLIDTFSIDPLYLCLRNYGVILVTDGESNACNDPGGADANKEWGRAARPTGRSTPADHRRHLEPRPDGPVRRQDAGPGHADQPQVLGHRLRV